MDHPPEFRRVLDTVREAAREALESGRATLDATTVKELYGQGSEYDAPAVVLKPRRPDAAAVVIEVQAGNIWWISAGDGPGYEFAEGDPEQWFSRLGDMVSAVVAGGYEDEWRDRPRRRLLRPWLWETTPEWRATFHTPSGPVSTWHIGVDPPAGAERKRRFEPY